ncbi:hypothetical protein U5A82_02820 [Sphingobium sp. CR2-8]|uniref:hypothetical protein n=1 Tax=Sphingobium sp. CR2-8 TaxID=1306534 RepID=UPI002DB5B7FA|nr:hypothetical protein [Sphingobium sp. CR2-8]MEC3909441.1 hypothetical protein [Sphingobium sp. CR2-8]
MSSFLDALSWLPDLAQKLGANGSAVAIGAAASGASSFARTWFTNRKAKKATEAAKFQSVLDSGDIAIIGDYLKRSLGTVSAGSYVNNDTVRRQVNATIETISKVVALDPNDSGKVSSQTVAASQKSHQPEITDPDDVLDTSVQPIPAAVSNSSILNEAMEELKSGKYWNALFAIRRDLEVRLRNLSGAGVMVNPGRLISDVEAAKAYKIFYRTASRAIHGDPVADDDVIAAMEAANYLYWALDNKPDSFRNDPRQRPSEVPL